MNEQQPFLDLPASLVDEVLKQATDAGNRLVNTFHSVQVERKALREKLIASGIVFHESNFGYPQLPTTCAADGSYAIERLLTADLTAAAAVVMEGLTPPSEKKYWQQPHHSTLIVVEPHHTETATILRAVMMGQELCLASNAPHELIMIDGSITIPIIWFNQATNKAYKNKELRCSQKFLTECKMYLEAYLTILQSQRTDKNFVALPKYSTRCEIAKLLNWPKEYDDKGLLTLLLEAGELTKPQPIEQPEQPWHLNLDFFSPRTLEDLNEIRNELLVALSQIYVFYYKPHEWLPALRVEFSQAIAENKYRLGVILQGLKYQCAVASMMEPYPLYLADRTVKSLARALPAFRQIATQQVAMQYNGDIGEVFLAMHGYRTETGR